MWVEIIERGDGLCERWKGTLDVLVDVFWREVVGVVMRDGPGLVCV